VPDPQLTEWTAMLLRWFHLVTGAAWIGASFYFNWLNNAVRPVESGDATAGLKGEVFAIHGGAFYRVSKFGGAPEQLPRELHWFKWEAYFTWITGFLLLVLTYWMDAKAMMVGGAGLSPGASVGVGAATLVLGYLVYDALCRLLGSRPVLLAGVGLLGFTGVAWALGQWLSPRAAAMHLGAMIGTIMATNVAHVIIPGQRDMVNAMVEGRPPPLERGKAGALRSLHNNYLTLPALFVMVANHYPLVWGHRHAWALLVAICVCGGLIRHGFNLRGLGANRPWVPSVVGSLGLVAVAAATWQRPAMAAADSGVSITAVQIVVGQRCLPCHAETPTQAGFLAAPKGLSLESRELIEVNRAKIGAQVGSQAMPLGNLTGMTDEERALVVKWAGG
jgi:uncharacterized membrane protein